MLSSELSGIEYINSLLASIWIQLDYIERNFIYQDNKIFWLDKENQQHNTSDEITKMESENSTIEVKDKTKFIHFLLEEYLNNLINAKDVSQIVIPVHLKDFATNQIEKWINSAILAKYVYKENTHYIVNNQSIVPVDYLNTGILQSSTKWMDCLHQFIEIKHGLRISKETVVTSFISNLGYFKRYGKNLYGMTCTLGTEDSQELLTSIYNIDLVFIPTYKEKQFIELPSIVVDNNFSWLEKIYKRTEVEIKNGRAILIICETIDAVNTIENKLKQNQLFKNIKRYTRNDNDECSSVYKSYNG